MKPLKKIITAILLAVFLMGVFQFCEKTSSSNLIDNEFQNPYEFVGDIHNSGLEFIINYSSLMKIPEIGIKDVCDITASFMLTCKGQGLEKYTRETYTVIGEKVTEGLLYGNIKGDQSNILTAGTIANGFLLKIKSTFKSINLEDTLATLKQISKIEKEIWFSKISENEKINLLIATAVGRHSLSFWYKEFKENKYLFNTKGRDWRKVLLDCLEADMDGAVVGFVAGAIVGATAGTVEMPGVGTITAAIVSGVYDAAYGAVLSSVLKAVKILIWEK